ncbi:MAG: hypothetical protein U1F58_11660 [Burkholderiales bacterium]
MSAKRFVVVTLAIGLAACTASGPRYADEVASLPGIPSHLARLTFFRTADRLQYSGRAATISIDGNPRRACELAGYHMVHVPAGPHVLSVDLWDAPGTCRFSVDVLGGEEYFYEVSPRTESGAAMFLGTLIGAFGGRAAMGGAPFAIMGAESSGKACGGAFSIVSVQEGAARRRLEGLHLSR